MGNRCDVREGEVDVWVFWGVSFVASVVVKEF